SLDLAPRAPEPAAPTPGGGERRLHDDVPAGLAAGITGSTPGVARAGSAARLTARHAAGQDLERPGIGAESDIFAVRGEGPAAHRDAPTRRAQEENPAGGEGIDVPTGNVDRRDRDARVDAHLAPALEGDRATPRLGAPGPRDARELDARGSEVDVSSPFSIVATRAHVIPAGVRGLQCPGHRDTAAGGDVDRPSQRGSLD